MYLSKLIFRKSLAIRQTHGLLQRSPQLHFNLIASPMRYFSSKPDAETEKEEVKPNEEKQSEDENISEKDGEEKHTGSDGESSVDDEEEYVLKAKDIKKLLKEQDDEIETLKKKLDNAINQYKYQLADNDNTVKRYKKEVNSAKEFAISKFAKDMLDIRDDLQMGIDYASKFDREGSTDIEEFKVQYDNLFKGVDMTNNVFDKIMKRHNVIEYRPIGEKFDPNFHEAITVVPDPTKEPNTVCDVMRTGWKIGDRVLRAAQVFVVKK
jgi:molecular chaperone GrpE